MLRPMLAIVLIIVLMWPLAAVGQEKSDKVKDPVCGMMVEKNPKLSARHKGRTYHFCMKADMKEFEKNPDTYLKGK